MVAKHFVQGEFLPSVNSPSPPPSLSRRYFARPPPLRNPFSEQQRAITRTIFVVVVVVSRRHACARLLPRGRVESRTVWRPDGRALGWCSSIIIIDPRRCAYLLTLSYRLLRALPTHTPQPSWKGVGNCSVRGNELAASRWRMQCQPYRSSRRAMTSNRFD